MDILANIRDKDGWSIEGGYLKRLSMDCKATVEARLQRNPLLPKWGIEGMGIGENYLIHTVLQAYAKARLPCCGSGLARLRK